MLIPLLGGAYEARSVIANAQRCVNLYPEINPVDAPVPVTHYPTPGLRILSRPSIPGPGRGLYFATGGTLYAAVKDTLYKIIPGTFQFQKVGDFENIGRISPVSMVDNEVTLFVVDGTNTSYLVDLTTGAFSVNPDINYQGSDFVDYLDGFFLFNKPGTPQFYSSLNNSTNSDPLFFANMTGHPTDLVGVVALHGTVWLIGRRSTEVWFNAGDTNLFPFQRMPQAINHQGCAAAYSIARHTGIDDSQSSVLWLSETDDGATVVLQGQGYSAKRVSSYAIEDTFRQFQRRDDAEAFTYQQDGHAFYGLNFPTDDQTWVYDLTTQQWHERVWIDNFDGNEHRYRVSNTAYAYGKVIGLDWETGALYELDLDLYTDSDGPVKRVRSWPHLRQEARRVMYTKFQMDIEVGTDPNATENNPALASLRWSDDHGQTWGNPVFLSLGSVGQYLTSPTKWRLGVARDRIFEISWSTPAPTALNGAYIDPIVLES